MDPRHRWCRRCRLPSEPHLKVNPDSGLCPICEIQLARPRGKAGRVQLPGRSPIKPLSSLTRERKPHKWLHEHPPTPSINPLGPYKPKSKVAFGGVCPCGVKQCSGLHSVTAPSLPPCPTPQQGEPLRGFSLPQGPLHDSDIPFSRRDGPVGLGPRVRSAAGAVENAVRAGARNRGMTPGASKVVASVTKALQARDARYAREGRRGACRWCKETYWLSPNRLCAPCEALGVRQFLRKT